MTAAGIVAFLAAHGYAMEIQGPDLVIRPELDSRLISRVRARKPEIVAFLRELGAPAAVSHFFVALDGVDVGAIRDYGVCIACGVPWALHGQQPERAWERVDDPNKVALIQAVAIVTEAAAARE